MSGLVLKLGPRERIMINGVVMENGDRRARLNVITRDARVLRLRDTIHPDEVNTPVTRVLYIAQMVLAGEADPAEADAQLSRGIVQLRHAFMDAESAAILDEAREAVEAGRYYPAMKALRSLRARETILLARAAAIARPGAH